MAPPVPIGNFVPPVTGINGSLKPVSNLFDKSGVFRSRAGSVKRRCVDQDSSEIEEIFDLGAQYPPLLFPDTPRIDLAAVKNLLVAAADESKKLDQIANDDQVDGDTRAVARSATALYRLVEAIVEKAVVPMWKKQDFIPAAHAQDQTRSKPPPVEGEAELREALEKADKESVVFDADLGSMPTYNRGKLSAAFSASLKNSVVASASASGGDAVESVRRLGDAFSAVERNPDDPKTGKFCTMPVKLKFTDRDSRIYFETTVKQLGGHRAVQSYPTPIRKELAAVTARIRATNPGKIVMVRPDARSLNWVISMKDDGDTRWIRDGVEPIDRSIMLPRFRTDTARAAAAGQCAGGGGSASADPSAK